MTTPSTPSTPPTPHPLDHLDDLDIHALLASRRQITVIWCTEDVQSIRPDLTADQAWEVLQSCKKFHGCEVGLNWLVLAAVANDMYPTPTKENDQ